MFKLKSGFTLVEIMVVMAIVALLVCVAIVEGVQFRKQANESNCLANLKAVASGFEVYAARHGGVYAPGVETNLQFLIEDNCLFQDLVAMNQMGNYRFVVGSINSGGYDVMGLVLRPALADHNYQIITGGVLKRTDTSVSSDMDFKNF